MSEALDNALVKLVAQLTKLVVNINKVVEAKMGEDGIQ